MFKLMLPDISDNLKFFFDKVVLITITAKLIKPECVHSSVCWGAVSKQSLGLIAP